MRVERGPGYSFEGEPSYVLRSWESIDEILAFRDEVRQESPTTQLLFILDDFGQAQYQSGHATNNYLPADLDLTEYSAIMTSWLTRQVAGSTMELDELLIPIDDPDIDLLGLLSNTDLVFRSPLGCFVVESAEPSMAIAAQPNGYFFGDLSGGQNFLLAERLRRDFGLEIFGLGSDSAVYCRPTSFSLVEAQDVVGSVKDMYRGMTDDLATQWAAKTAGQRWFLLSYRGA